MVQPSDPLAPLAGRPEVVQAATAARAAVDSLLRHRVLRGRSAEVTAEAGLRCARASAQLEGVGVELERLRGQLLAGGPLTMAGAETVAAAVRVNAELGAVLPAFARAPRQALARLHALAAAGLVDDGVLGRPRSLADPLPADPLGLGPPPSPLVVAARLDGLAEVLGTSAAPALVVAAVVHGELLALRPFVSANGLVARAAARLVLVDRGLDPKAVTAPDVGHVELTHQHGDPDEPAGVPGYAEAARGYVLGGQDGVVGWVRHCAAAVGLGAREGLAVCEALRRGEDLAAG